MAESSNSKQSLSEITKRLSGTFTTNQIKGLSVNELKIYRDKGKIIIDANYEKRTPLFEGVDAVLIFDDNVIIID